MDEDPGFVSGGGITTHHNGGVVVLIKIGVERRLAGRTPTLLLFEQVDAIEASSFPHQTPLPAIFPVVTQARVEGATLALDLHEAGHSGFVVAWEPEPAVTKDPAVSPIDTVVAIDHPVSRLVGMTALGPFVSDPPHVVGQNAEGALGDRMTVVIAPSRITDDSAMITSAVGRCRFSRRKAESVAVAGQPRPTVADNWWTFTETDDCGAPKSAVCCAAV